MAARLQCLERYGVRVSPLGKVGVHCRDEGDELAVVVDRGLDCRFLDGEVEIARAVFLEQAVPQLRKHGPVSFQRINIGGGDASLQMARDVLSVLGCLTVDVAWQVEVELVLLDLREGHHACIFRDIEPFVEDVHDLVDVHTAQPVLGAVLHEATTGVDHEDALARLGILLVDNHDASGDTRAVKEVGGQADDAPDVALAHKTTAYIRLGVAPETERRAVGRRRLCRCS